MVKVQAMYQIKITLNDMKPPVWRRLIVPSTIALNELHKVIQIAMGWGNYHLYCFEKGNLRYGEELGEACIPTNPDREEINQHLIADIDVREYNLKTINERLTQFYS